MISGSTYLGLISLYGTKRVRAALTKMYPKVTMPIDITVAIGMEKDGFLASSPDVAMLSKPTNA